MKSDETEFTCKIVVMAIPAPAYLGPWAKIGPL